MNFLFVGFSDQNANLLTFFVQKRHPEVKCAFVPRRFAEDLRLVLPELSPIEATADAYIVNLDGVGMTSYATSTHKAELVEFLANKPAILLSRGNVSQWQGAQILPEYTLYQRIPYNQNEMGSLIEELLANVDKYGVNEHGITEEFSSPLRSQSSHTNPAHNEPHHTKSNHNEPSRDEPSQTMSVRQSASEMFGSKAAFHAPKKAVLDDIDEAYNVKKVYAFKETAVQKPVVPSVDKIALSNQSKVQESPLQDLMQRYFDKVYQNNLLREFISVFLNTEPFKLTAGTQEVFIHPKRNIAMGRNVNRLLDYCAIAGGTKVLSHSVLVEPLTEAQFDALEGYLKNATYRRHSLNALLWQVYSVILPLNVVVDDHPLKLKVRFMPNFGGMHGIPDYVHAVMATCLIAPKSIEELQEIFPKFINDKDQLQRVLVLAILSGAADMTVLESSATASQQAEEAPPQSNNEAVTKANKTGFLKRLLKKLTL